MICPVCRTGAADRAYLSLDAVANGEVPPTAAVGYGFHVMGERPVVDAEILKTIGCRPAPLVGTQRAPVMAYGRLMIRSSMVRGIT